MRQKPAGRPSSSEHIIQDIKRKTCKQYSAEEKIRIVLDGLRGDDNMCGQGRYFIDGCQFIGKWKDDSPDGKCTYITPDGEKRVEVIRDFQIIEEE